jgi:hypothetical protein
MTAITLNLLAEEQLAAQAEARDPFRLTLSTSISVIVLTAIAGALITNVAAKRRAECDALRAKLETLSPDQTDAANGDTKSLKGVADDLIAMNHGRTLYAQQLSQIKDLVPPAIQLVRMNFQLAVENPESGAPTDAPSDTGADAAKVVRHKPKNVQRLILQLDGKAISSRPEIEVDQFIKTLRADPVLSRQVKDIKLRSIARAGLPTDATAAAVPSASFVIECLYRERR